MKSELKKNGIETDLEGARSSRKRTRSVSRVRTSASTMGERSVSKATSLAREQSLAAKRHRAVSKSRDRSMMGIRNASVIYF